jgi:hypothetical protein
MINWQSWLLWGFSATIVLTTLSSGLQGLGLTRMNLPYILGTIFTPNRDKARLYGFVAHIGVGIAFSLLYVFIFQSWRVANVWRGGLIGLIHALFLLIVGLSLLPGLHPRMASEVHGPTANRELEPPGFLGLHYGVQTPLSVIICHVIYGALLGAFYQLK